MIMDELFPYSVMNNTYLIIYDKNLSPAQMVNNFINFDKEKYNERKIKENEISDFKKYIQQLCKQREEIHNIFVSFCKDKFEAKKKYFKNKDINDDNDNDDIDNNEISIPIKRGIANISNNMNSEDNKDDDKIINKILNRKKEEVSFGNNYNSKERKNKIYIKGKYNNKKNIKKAIRKNKYIALRKIGKYYLNKN